MLFKSFLQVMEGLCIWEKHETILETLGLEQGCVWLEGGIFQGIFQDGCPGELSISAPDSSGRMGVLTCSQGAQIPLVASLGHSKQIC